MRELLLNNKKNEMKASDWLKSLIDSFGAAVYNETNSNRKKRKKRKL